MGRFTRERSELEFVTATNSPRRHNLKFPGDFEGCVGAGLVARHSTWHACTGRQSTSPQPSAVKTSEVSAEKTSVFSTVFGVVSAKVSASHARTKFVPSRLSEADELAF